MERKRKGKRVGEVGMERGRDVIDNDHIIIKHSLVSKTQAGQKS